MWEFATAIVIALLTAGVTLTIRVKRKIVKMRTGDNGINIEGGVHYKVTRTES